MGNVMAASPLAGPAVPMAPPMFDEGSPASSKMAEEPNIGNPGVMEDLHKRCKDVFPMAFEGARVVVNKGLSNHFQVSHTLNMSSITPSGYRFGATYVGTNMVGPGEAYPVLLGDVDPNGNVNANIIHQLNERTKAKMVFQIQESKCVNNQITADYRADNYTTSLTLGNCDLVNRSGISVLHYLQAVTPRVDLGAEIAYQQGPNVPGGGMAVVSVAGRYKSADNYILSATLGTGRANVCYFHRGVDPNLQIGVEIETDLRQGESTASLGYQLEIPKANMTFRGSVDSNWQVQGTLEKRLLPLPFTFMMSGHMVHGTPKPNFKFGCGLVLG
ncbi:Mitochondrial import receptor subunit TOM40 -like protein 1 [Halotydeus destructor]|nr:Mitochondrial import receptor subunit TOM40 -like protein 1 [Halotydeus destructor]